MGVIRGRERGDGRWRRLLDRPWAVAALAALGPAAWGTTYVTTTELLPPDRPLAVSALRALPAGLLLLAFTRRLPRGRWWMRATVLGLLNFGAFFPLLFYGAYRLPGGVASTVGALSPLLVAGLGVVVLRARPGPGTLLAALLGLSGVALLVLRADAALDAAGMAAMLSATSLMALAVVLAKRWGRPPGVSLLALTGWQLTVGGLVLAPLALLVEGAPPAPTAGHVAGYVYLGLIGTVLAYALWFRGIERLPASSMSFLGLANPVVASFAGLVLLGQSLTGWQLLGLTLVLLGVLWGQRASQRPRVIPESAPSSPPEREETGASGARATVAP
ncbi:probable blue pigment (indigoidine) exporter [Streptomyces zhaozhouensis]|uniref:Probable blue pigment (Indigoidine) exporter n=1 Tax=Streptomyces zhaozhouensis TaxID=1300267 RepID=A0A286DWW7_9ACTN|nr:EamA family transporter [Streptomyces zhaozhouensis]SOD63152.1 probable blue pigment (indigoidine) exporter [Streptomyces zhaozhouensis]